jgi:hypothetical protein
LLAEKIGNAQLKTKKNQRVIYVTLPIRLPRLEAYIYREHDENPSFLQGVKIENFLLGSIPLPKVWNGSISLPKV